MEETKKILCIYHSVDTDGVLSAVVVDKWAKINKCNNRLVFKGWTYGNLLPTLNLEEYEIIFMVDISFPPEAMLELKNQTSTKIIWIDHHNGSIGWSNEYDYSDLPGIRQEGTGACELCWKFLIDQNYVPSVIQKMAAYDVWDHNRFDWDNEILPLQYGIRSEYGTKLLFNEYGKLINEDLRAIGKLEKIGRTILNYENKKRLNAAKNYSFPVTVAGKYKGIACLTTDFGSALFDSVKDQYDIYICLNRKMTEDGKIIYPMSVYSEPGRLDFNLSDFMHGYNGGGHPTAAGGFLNEEQFFNIITKGEI